VANPLRLSLEFATAAMTWTWFFVRNLRDQSVVGMTCCAVPGEIMVEQELRGWRAAKRVQVPTTRGVVGVEHAGDLDRRLVAEGLRALGFPVTAWAVRACGQEA
jgi:hypothetical protein